MLSLSEATRLIENTVRRFKDRGYSVTSTLPPDCLTPDTVPDPLQIILFGPAAKGKKRQITEEEFQRSIYAQGITGAGEKVAAIFISESIQSLGVNGMAQFLIKMTANKFKRTLLVCQKPIAPQTRQLIQESSNNKHVLEILHLWELLHVSIDNNIVPMYRLLSSEEAEQMLKAKRLQVNNLPPLERSDPIVRYYGAKAGQVFFVEDRVATSGYAGFMKRVK